MKTEKLLDEKKNSIFIVDCRAITIIDNFNVRQDYGDIEELAASIHENGVKVPLRGRRDQENEGHFLLTDGHRRLKACMLLVERGNPPVQVPFRLEPQGYSDEQRIVDMFVTNDSKLLNIVEQSEAIQRLVNYNYSEKEISQKTGRSNSFIRNCVLLNSAPKAIKNLIVNKKISHTLVVELFKNKKYEEAIETINSITTGINGNDTDKKATKKDVMKKEQKFNSISFFRKVSKSVDERIIREDKKELFEFAQNLIAGKYDKKHIEDLFFVEEMEEELKMA